jgi:hypothetical protein
VLLARAMASLGWITLWGVQLAGSDRIAFRECNRYGISEVGYHGIGVNGDGTRAHGIDRPAVGEHGLGCHITSFIKSRCSWGVGSRGAVGWYWQCTIGVCECGRVGYCVAGVRVSGTEAQGAINLPRPVEPLRFVYSSTVRGVICGRCGGFLCPAAALLDRLPHYL